MIWEDWAGVERKGYLLVTVTKHEQSGLIISQEQRICQELDQEALRRFDPDFPKVTFYTDVSKYMAPGFWCQTRCKTFRVQFILEV